MLNDIMKNSNKHLSSSLQTNNDSLIENNYFSIFPIKNMDELTILEDKLNDNDFRLKLQSYLARLERPSVSDMTRQIMAKMFHNNLLAQFSYVGQKKKKIFSILNSCTIIFGKNKIYIIFNINLNIIIHLHGKQNNIPISYTYFFNVSASVRSVQAHRNCTDLE
ncbi:MATH and LRR domain-containing protein PFE0570w, partial [Aphis craccivora]